MSAKRKPSRTQTTVWIRLVIDHRVGVSPFPAIDYELDIGTLQDELTRTHGTRVVTASSHDETSAARLASGKVIP